MCTGLDMAGCHAFMPIDPHEGQENVMLKLSTVCFASLFRRYDRTAVAHSSSESLNMTGALAFLALAAAGGFAAAALEAAAVDAGLFPFAGSTAKLPKRPGTHMQCLMLSACLQD